MRFSILLFAASLLALSGRAAADGNDELLVCSSVQQLTAETIDEAMRVHVPAGYLPNIVDVDQSTTLIAGDEPILVVTSPEDIDFAVSCLGSVGLTDTEAADIFFTASEEFQAFAGIAAQSLLSTDQVQDLSQIVDASGPEVSIDFLFVSGGFQAAHAAIIASLAQSEPGRFFWETE